MEGPDGPAKSRLETASSDCMPVFDAAALAASVVVGVASEHDHETYEELWEPYVVESQAIVRRSPFDGRQDAGVSSSPRRHAPVDHDNRLGLEIVQDLVRVPSADALCGPESAFATVRCYDGQRQVTNTDPSAQGGVMAGFLTPTQRVLASYERTLTGPFGAMVRAGLAFGDTAPAEAHEARFPPLHFELNARYRFGGPRVRGAAFAGAGVARLGSRFETSVLECHSAPPCDPLDGTGVFRQVVVHQPLGPAFATLGADVLWAVADDVGVLARAGGLFSFPEPSFVLQPSVGVSAGF